MTQEASWTMVNITYMFGSYLMFHYVRGVPFEFNAGAYDNLNMWEQIDNGDQYTPAKKFLLSVPIGLFLVSTHYTHYDLTYFTINTLAVLAVVIPKLPWVCFLVLRDGYPNTNADAEPQIKDRPVFGPAGGSIGGCVSRTDEKKKHTNLLQGSGSGYLHVHINLEGMAST